MKKLMKRLIAVAAAITMVLAMAIPAMAASITINPQNPEDTQSNTTEYHYYQLLDATISGTNVAYSIPDTEAGTTLKNSLAAVTYTKTVDGEQKTVTPFSFTESADKTKWVATINSDVAENDGEALANALNTDAIKGAALANNTFKQAAGSSAKADGLANGYYLITSNLGTALVAQTLGDVTINTKNSYPSLTKTEDKQNMKTGDTITYTLTVSVPRTATVGQTITVHDTLDPMLTANLNNISAKFGDTTVDLSNADKKADTETFAKSFTITDAMLGQNVVITYTAELKDEAKADTAYKNSAFLDYSEFETKPSEVEVKTFDIDLTKTFVGSSDSLKATFELRTNANDKGTALQFVKDDTGYVVADTTAKDADKSATIEATNNTKVNIRGLAQGTYYLVETGTADGYNALTNAITVTVDADGNATFRGTGATGANSAVTVENNAGSVLPSTGGMGTTIFYVLGAALVIGAGVVLVTRRRLSK